MRYHVHWHKRGVTPFKPPSTLITNDGWVIYATPAMSWAVGHKFEVVDEWCANKLIRLTLVGMEFQAPEIPEPEPEPEIDTNVTSSHAPSNDGRKPKQLLIEAQYGKPFWEVVKQLADEGKTMAQAADILGYSRSGAFNEMLSRNNAKPWFAGNRKRRTYAEISFDKTV